MISISNRLIVGLRKPENSHWLQDENFCESNEILKEKERERFYVITSFKCNCQCKYCLFRFERIKDCPDYVMAEKVGRILNAYPDSNFSMSITGGEPLLKAHRVISILDAIRGNQVDGQVRWIGFGTNGTVPVPTYLNNYPEFRFDLYMSRHHYDPNILSDVFGCTKLQSVDTYRNSLGNHVNLRLSCNLIEGGIDSLGQIKKFLGFYYEKGIRQITFRELNKVAGDASMYNSSFITDYIDYYGTNLIPIQSILSEIDKDTEFTFISQDIRPFIYHERWKYKNMELTFRRIDEEQLLKYNDTFDGIDEIVLHPDGLVTGCWDRNQKVLRQF